MAAASEATVMRQQPMVHVPPVTMAGAVGPSAMPGFGNASLYVGDLETNVNEEHLFDLFNQVAQVISVRVCRDLTTRKSLGYGYINFNSSQEANNAMELLNFTPLNGKPIRVMFSHRDPSLRKSGYANVFIKNLDLSIDHKALYETFATFGNILSCKVAMNSNGQSKGYGFVQFDKEEAAANAIKSLNGMLLNDKQVYVGLFIRRQKRYRGDGYHPKYTNVYVKNLSETVSDEELKTLFSPFGVVTSAVVMRDANGKSRCFGFVNFESSEYAVSAVENLNGTTHDDKVWYVGRAQKKSEREAELRAKFQQDRLSRFEKLQGCNMYMKNLDDSIDDEKLREMFSEFGTITSCKVMIDVKGASKGSGFVAFTTPEEATRALTEMNGKMVGAKPLYIAVAQRKEERKARLQSTPSTSWNVAGLTRNARFPPWNSEDATSATLHWARQPCFNASPATRLRLPTANDACRQLSKLHDAFSSQTTTTTSKQQWPKDGDETSCKCSETTPPPTTTGSIAFAYSTTGNRHLNQGIRSTPNTRNGVDSSVSLFNGSEIAHPPLSSVLMSALCTASLDQQRIILGEHLYPLVEKIERDNAAKVTGMLLEMDQPEVLRLIESPDALKKKVAEALDVLRQAAARLPPATGAADVSNGHLSSLPPTK
ncbi:hypothetical protein V2J09_024229 [Rumex salicifolius]